LDGLCPTLPATIGLFIKLANAIEWLRDALRRLYKSTGTEASFAYWLAPLPACGKVKRQESDGIGLGWKSLVAGTFAESTSCRTCTPVSQKRMNAPGANCSNTDTFNAESSTPLTWVQGIFSSGSAGPAICGVRSKLSAEFGVRNAECEAAVVAACGFT